MTTFTDAKGREWEITLTFASVERIKDSTGLDLLDDPSAVESLLSSLFTLVNCLWAVVKPKAEAAGITAEDFGEALAGEQIVAARDAFWDELLNFTPPARRAPMKALMQTLKTGETKAQGMLARVDVAGSMGKMIDTELARLETELRALGS